MWHSHHHNLEIPLSIYPVHNFLCSRESHDMLQIRDQLIVTATNLSPVVSIYAIFFLLLSTFSIVGRVFTKVRVVRRLTADDRITISATIHS